MIGLKVWTLERSTFEQLVYVQTTNDGGLRSAGKHWGPWRLLDIFGTRKAAVQARKDHRKMDYDYGGVNRYRLSWTVILVPPERMKR